MPEIAQAKEKEKEKEKGKEKGKQKALGNRHRKEKEKQKEVGRETKGKEKEKGIMHGQEKVAKAKVQSMVDVGHAEVHTLSATAPHMVEKGALQVLLEHSATHCKRRDQNCQNGWK